MTPNTEHKKQIHVFVDVIFLFCSLAVAIYILETNSAQYFIDSLGDFGYFATFIAGLCFTSVFTTAPAIAVLSKLSMVNPIWAVVLIGGLGAVIGDYIIFRFIRDRVTDDVEFLVKKSVRHEWSLIFKKRLFRWLGPFIGALIIASPFPDEFGIALMGMAKLKDRIFLPLSFTFNALGILVIWFVSQ
jgi:hypothetical protein